MSAPSVETLAETPTIGKRPLKILRRKLGKMPPPLSFPATLNRRNIYVLPTRYGLLFVTVLAAMLLGALNYNNNLGFLLTFLLGGMAFVSILYTVRNLSGLTVGSVRSRPVFAGETASFKFVLQTTAPDRPAVRFAFPESPEIQQDLPAGMDALIILKEIARTRGVFSPGPLTISTRYPLGIFRSWARLNLPTECLVYPKPLPGPLALSDGPSASGESGSRPMGPGAEDFQGLRPYAPGDPLQHISWKTYSQGQGLFTKRFTAQRGAAVRLEWDRLGTKDPEERLSRLCYMVLDAHRRHILYGLRLPGVEVLPDWGEAHKHECLRALARFGNAPGRQ